MSNNVIKRVIKRAWVNTPRAALRSLRYGIQKERPSPCAETRDACDRKRRQEPFRSAWRNGTSFGLNDLEALLTVAHEAKEWIATLGLKRRAS
jgi:hypothetical protein